MVAAATSIISVFSVTIDAFEKFGEIFVVSISSADGMQGGGKGSLIPAKTTINTLTVKTLWGAGNDWEVEQLFRDQVTSQYFPSAYN